ncbi:MAG: hypothetical protein R2873_34065 [Caldilineaceae bacterium]
MDVLISRSSVDDIPIIEEFHRRWSTPFSQSKEKNQTPLSPMVKWRPSTAAWFQTIRLCRPPLRLWATGSVTSGS